MNLVLPGPLGSRVTSSSSIGRRGAGVGEARALGADLVGQLAGAAAPERATTAGVRAGQTSQRLTRRALVDRSRRAVRADGAAGHDVPVDVRLSDRAAQEARQEAETDQGSHVGELLGRMALQTMLW